MQQQLRKIEWTVQNFVDTARAPMFRSPRVSASFSPPPVLRSPSALTSPSPTPTVTSPLVSEDDEPDTGHEGPSGSGK